MKQKVVLIIVDSLDWRWVNNTSMPFLTDCLKKFQKTTLNTLLGFSASIYACLWPSAYPSNHNVWCHFNKKKVVTRINFFIRTFYKLIPEFASIPLRFYYNIITHNEPGVAIFPPLESLHYFKKIDYNFNLPPKKLNGFPTIFQVLGKEARWIFQKNINELAVCSDEDNLFDVIFLGEIDQIAHHHEHIDSYMMKALQKTDLWLKKTFENYNRKYGKELHFFIMSDHGQEQIKNFIDVEGLIKKSSLKYYIDYLAFYESGFVRFWNNHNNAERTIRNCLNRIKCGHFLTKEEIKKFNIEVNNNDHGDLFFLLDPGNLVFPNYHQRLRFLKKRYKSMHGYSPDHISMKGIFCYIGQNRLDFKKEMQVIDIVPTILDFLDISKPESMIGKSRWIK